MPWLFDTWSESVKKLSCRYVLQRYLGQFLEEKLSLNQLTVDLYNGIGSVSDVALDVQALNELGETQNLPFEFVDGFISEIKVGVPWSSLLTESSSLEVNGLNLVIQPKQRADSGASMFESMWSSMTSSIQLAEECLKQSSEPLPENERLNALNGVEDFAKTIDSILARVKIKFVNTSIRIEHLPKDKTKGAAVEIHIKQFSYFDETSTETFDENRIKHTSAYGIKVFFVEGLELYTNEFYASNRTISRSLLIESSLSEEKSEIFDRRKVNHDIIMFGKLIGKQELRLKIKQRENVSGPKVDFELNLSSLVIFLSPRQLRTVCEVVCGLTSPHLQDTSNVVSKPRHNQKPMTTSDFERVEQELNQQINPPNLTTYVSKSLQNTTGWSSSGVEEESDDDFHPVKGHTCSSLTSSVANSVSSSYNSSYSSYHFNSKTNEQSTSSQPRHHHSKHKEKGGTSDSDFNGDFSSFQLRLNLLAVILLHQDVLLSVDDSFLPEDSSIENMKSLSRQFFTHFMSLNTNCHGRSDFKHGRQILQSASERNHFRLYCTTLMINGEEKSSSTSSEIHGSLTVANAELVECLMELKNKKLEIVELLQFNQADSKLAKDTSVFSQPDINAGFKYFKNLKHFSAPNRTELTVKLQECSTEIDVTIIDRLTHVLNNLDSLRISLNKSSNPTRTVLSDVHAPVIDYKLEWKVTSSSIFVKLRFPIPDLRTDFDYSNSFWYERNIYNDVLLAELSEASVQSLAHQLAQCFELQCKSVRLSFLEANCDKPITFLFSDVDEKFNISSPSGEKGFGWPRVVLRLYPKVGFIELEEEEESDLTHSHMFQSIMQTQKEPSPFAAKLVKRESDTPHLTSTTPDNTDEIILPGTKEEIGEFIEDASRNALIQLNVTLPGILFQIPSKHFYEIIYNRFSTDLMLWTPRSSRESFRAQEKNSNQNFNFNFNTANSMFTSFTLCKSGVNCNSDSDDEAQGENLMFHTETISESQKKKASKQQQSLVAVSIFVAEGVLDVFPHARNSSGKVIPEQFGEIQFLFREADLFCVSGYKAVPFLNYTCLQINHVSLYHCSLIPSGVDVSLKRVDSYPSKHLLPTLYKTQQGGIINESASSVGVGSINSDDMLTLAIRTQGQENRMKNICLANSLNGVTMRHRMKTAYTSWLSQLIDFFDVVDYPVLHYQPWKVVTQLHQQFLNCVIDYRPIHLPLKAALTVENFNISSNITAKTSTSILRLIAEEGSLFISNKVNEGCDTSEDLSIDLKNDYVCVVDMGLFELSLRLTDNGEGEPQTDLRASNNIVHIRTCADSTVALMDLVKYIASDGDLCDKNIKEDFIINKSSDSNENMLVDLNMQIGEDDDLNNGPILNQGNLNVFNEGVPHLVEEAINDTTVIEPTRRRSANSRSEDQGKVEVFYFPNEVNISNDEVISQALSDSQSSDDEVEKDYFILEPDMLAGYMRGNNVPQVRLLTKEPIRMVDNHFSVPVSKVDVLKAPKNYPAPLSKYTLREMTIVWHMYGGNDFIKTPAAETTIPKKHVTIVTDSRRSSQESLTSNFEDLRSSKKSSIDNVNITYLNARSPDSQSVQFVIPQASPSPRVSFSDFPTDSPTALYDRQKDNSWQVKGGPDRNQDALMELKLTKLKYQFEIYPKNTKQASRQVLLVQEVEIRDRMATSKINKFLYQYSSTARPKQSNANMVVIKSTNIRPEKHISHLQECCLRVSLLPLRLNIDQDSLLFLINYFSEISGNTKCEENTAVTKSTPEPVMNIENINITKPSSPMVKLEDKKVSSVTHVNNTPVFIRSFEFSPDVPIRLDYQGKRVDLTHGPLAGLIMGLGQLNCSELKLKRIYHRQGFLGLEKLIAYVLAEWLQDIKKNQLPSILGGVGPMYSVVQLFQGIRDLFWLPIEQYQKDGRIVRGLQRGANSFTTSSAMAVLEITARLVYAIQRIAETAFDIVSPGPSISYLRYYDRNDKNKSDRRLRRYYKYNQPADIREGFATALQLVKEGFGETAQTLVRVASVEHEVKGAVGAVGGVLREIPSTAIKPIIIASQATTNVLDGVRSQLVPDARTEAALKWRTDYF